MEIAKQFGLSSREGAKYRIRRGERERERLRKLAELKPNHEFETFRQTMEVLVARAGRTEDQISGWSVAYAHRANLRAGAPLDISDRGTYCYAVFALIETSLTGRDRIPA